MGDKGLEGVTGVETELQVVTRSYNGLQGVSRGDKG